MKFGVEADLNEQQKRLSNLPREPKPLSLVRGNGPASASCSTAQIPAINLQFIKIYYMATFGHLC
jgi:hypothetical protein